MHLCADCWGNDFHLPWSFWCVTPYHKRVRKLLSSGSNSYMFHSPDKSVDLKWAETHQSKEIVNMRHWLDIKFWTHIDIVEGHTKTNTPSTFGTGTMGLFPSLRNSYIPSTAFSLIGPNHFFSCVQVKWYSLLLPNLLGGVSMLCSVREKTLRNLDCNVATCLLGQWEMVSHWDWSGIDWGFVLFFVSKTFILSPNYWFRN